MADMPPQSSAQYVSDPPFSEEEATVGKMLLQGLSRKPDSDVVGAGVRDAVVLLASIWGG